MTGNDEYRAALQRCRVCRTCSTAAPEQRTICQIDAYIEKQEQAHAAVMNHFTDHKC
jgi:hypothetical protein